jgi:hypothetical protein
MINTIGMANIKFNVWIDPKGCVRRNVGPMIHRGVYQGLKGHLKINSLGFMKIVPPITEAPIT